MGEEVHTIAATSPSALNSGNGFPPLVTSGHETRDSSIS